MPLLNLSLHIVAAFPVKSSGLHIQVYLPIKAQQDHFATAERSFMIHVSAAGVLLPALLCKGAELARID